MQGDYLCWTLDVLSPGRNHHTPLLYALLATLLLWGLQVGLTKWLHRLPARAYALTALPGAVGLVMLTAYPYDSTDLILWIAALAVGYVLWRTVVRFGQKAISATRTCTWNVLILFALFLFVGLGGNTDDTRHYELRAARLLLDGKDEEALQVGRKSLSTTPRLTAMRALALSRQGELPEQLFHYPQYYGCNGLLLRPQDELWLQFPVGPLYSHLKCPPLWGGDARRYFDSRVRQAAMAGNRVAQDYRLCALLLEKDIDRFAKELPAYYALDSLQAPLPAAYNEALTLYCQIRTRPVFLYSDEVTKTNYNDFETLRRKPGSFEEKSARVRKEYGDTYWWYYFYGSIERTGPSH